jgi:hypothetical protein
MYTLSMADTFAKNMEATQSYEANTVYSATDYSQYAHHPLRAGPRLDTKNKNKARSFDSQHRNTFRFKRFPHCTVTTRP